MQKRGQGLSVTTLVLIILGVLILVFLILGFTLGWTKILPFIKPSNNVQSVVDKCDLSCNTASQYDFCSVKREVITEGVITLATGISFDKVDLKAVSCFDLSVLPQLGFKTCGAVDCGIAYGTQKVCEAANKQWNLAVAQSGTTSAKPAECVEKPAPVAP